jgi:hypothetical protein
MDSVLCALAAQAQEANAVLSGSASLRYMTGVFIDYIDKIEARSAG